MKISPISNFNYTNRNKVSFNGVFAKTIRSCPDYDPVIATTIHTQTATYYPFYGETQEEIDKVVAQNSSSEIIRNAEGKRQLLVRKCIVARKMETEESYYNEYSKIKKVENVTDMPDELIYTHAFVKDKYLDSGFLNSDGTQKPAVNKIVYDAFAKQNIEY